MKRSFFLLSLYFCFYVSNVFAAAVVLQTDFGLKDGAVSAMRGVIASVDSNIGVSDLTHEIPAYNIWQAAYRLYQTAPYWPAGTVFVSVVDPGVGTERKSIVARSKSGHYFVTPDNGTLTLVDDMFGIDEIRQIDETKNRRPGSADSYTFHGRDVYAFTAARLASSKISFEEVGPKLSSPLVKLAYEKPRKVGSKIIGTLEILDPQYGNVWSNIEQNRSVNFKKGTKIGVKIFKGDRKVFDQVVPFANTFGDVKEGMPLLYWNSLMKLSLALNMGNFAETYKIESGPDWKLEIEKLSL